MQLKIFAFTIFGFHPFWFFFFTFLILDSIIRIFFKDSYIYYFYLKYIYNNINKVSLIVGLVTFLYYIFFFDNNIIKLLDFNIEAALVKKIFDGDGESNSNLSKNLISSNLVKTRFLGDVGDQPWDYIKLFKEYLSTLDTIQLAFFI